jgi:hypothetical protein
MGSDTIAVRKHIVAVGTLLVLCFVMNSLDVASYISIL